MFIARGGLFGSLVIWLFGCLLSCYSLAVGLLTCLLSSSSLAVDAPEDVRSEDDGEGVRAHLVALLVAGEQGEEATEVAEQVEVGCRKAAHQRLQLPQTLRRLALIR